MHARTLDYSHVFGQAAAMTKTLATLTAQKGILISMNPHVSKKAGMLEGCRTMKASNPF